MHTSCYFLNKGFSAWFNYNLVGPLSSLTRHHLLCWQQWRFTWTLLTSVVLPNTTPTICTLHSNFWSQSLGELLLSQAGWRSHPLIIVIGESKARGCTVQIWSACTSTSPMPSNASQDTVINNCWNISGPGFGKVVYCWRKKLDLIQEVLQHPDIESLTFTSGSQHVHLSDACNWWCLHQSNWFWARGHH